MLYCPPNITFNHIWFNHGTTHCFMDTIGPAVSAGFVLLFGSIQLFMYRKYATRIMDPAVIPKSALYIMQIVLLCLFPLLQFIRFLYDGLIVTNSAFYGYMVNIKLVKFTEISL